MEIGKEGDGEFPNRWPTEEADSNDEEGQLFTQTMKDFFVICKELHIKLMQAIALGMGLDEHFFDSYTDGGDNNLRLLHYPSVQRSVFRQKKGQVRAGEHSDYGSVTLLFQDSRGGLQVRSPHGNFIDAIPVEGTIVVNAGDLLARWSNDEIRSTKHRVVEPPLRKNESEENGLDDDGRRLEENGDEMYPARYSVAYFCNPNFDRFIEALPGTWEETGKKYEGIYSGAYLVQRLEATY